MVDAGFVRAVHAGVRCERVGFTGAAGRAGACHLYECRPAGGGGGGRK